MTLSFLSTDHKLKTGTNTKKALQAVYSMMSWEGNSPPEGWNRTRHVILLMTDGQKGPLLPDSRTVCSLRPAPNGDLRWGP